MEPSVRKNRNYALEERKKPALARAESTESIS
jgi:hypothetical protein